MNKDYATPKLFDNISTDIAGKIVDNLNPVCYQYWVFRQCLKKVYLEKFINIYEIVDNVYENVCK